jgi:hypothetical protein
MVAVGAVVILSLALTSAAVDRRFAALRQRETEESRRAADQAEAALREPKATQQSLIQAEKMASLSWHHAHRGNQLAAAHRRIRRRG